MNCPYWTGIHKALALTSFRWIQWKTPDALPPFADVPSYVIMSEIGLVHSQVKSTHLYFQKSCKQVSSAVPLITPNSPSASPTPSL